MHQSRALTIMLLALAALIVPVRASASDCNGNGIEDGIETNGGIHHVASPNKTVNPFVGLFTHLFLSPPPASGPVELRFFASNIGDGTLDPIILNGQFIGSANWSGTAGCGSRSAFLQLPAATFNALVAGQNAEFGIGVNTNGCLATGSMRMELIYAFDPLAPDCNGNGQPDGCDLIPDISPTPPGNCAQAEPVCPGYTYHHSVIKGSSDFDPDMSACAQRDFTTFNVYYRYVPADSGPLNILVEYDSPGGLQPTVYLHGGCPVTPGNLIACDTSQPSTPLVAQINANVTAGVTYIIRIAKRDPPLGNNYRLTLTGPPCLMSVPGVGGPFDCNANGVPDACDVDSGTSDDCNTNGIPDECEPDCNANGVPDACDISSGTSPDCNSNSVPDECDVAAGVSQDCNTDTIPDECNIAAGTSQDCNANRVPDECDFASGALTDCNSNGQADACEISACRYPGVLVENTTFSPDEAFLGPPDGIGEILYNRQVTYQLTCSVIANLPGPDFNIYETASGPGHFAGMTTISVSQDGVNFFDVRSSEGPVVHIPGDQLLLNDIHARSYSLPPTLQSARYVRIGYSGGVVTSAIWLDAIGVIHAVSTDDCNANEVPDDCDIASGTSPDSDGNGQPDECAIDCDNDGLPDPLELQFALEPDCNGTGVLDHCEADSGAVPDCNDNSNPDSCDIASGASPDCNGNGVPDSCDLAQGTSPDCNSNGIPDECDITSGFSPDCTGNGVPDECDVADGTEPDCNANSVPDVCDISSGTDGDCNGNHIPDSCDLTAGTDIDCNANQIPDACDLAGGTSTDCDANGVPDECDGDCNSNGVPDACEQLQFVTADAGPDRSICPGETITLGGAPAGSGGTPPYLYQWMIDGLPLEPPLVDQEQTSGPQVLSGSFHQTFTAGMDGELRAVEVFFESASGNGTLTIYAGIFGELLSQHNVTLGSGWQRFDLPCPVPVKSGNLYMLSFSSFSLTRFRYDGSNPYAGGVLNTNPSWDLAFRTYVGRPTGICGTDVPNPNVRPQQTTRYTLKVTDATGCFTTDDAVITVRTEEPCVKLIALTVGGERPYVLGQSVPIGVMLSAPAPAGGLTVHVQAGGFGEFTLNIAEGEVAAEQNAVAQTLGVGLSATAEIEGMGGIISTGPYDVLPLVQSITILTAPPYQAGQMITIRVTLREPALAGGATVMVSSDAFDRVAVGIDPGMTEGVTQALLNMTGTGFTATARAFSQAAHSAVSTPFDVAPSGVLYVDVVNGSDANDGLTPTTALATIGKANLVADDGFIVHVAAGTYHENVVLTRNLVVRGAGAEQTVVDAAGAGRALEIQGQVRVVISGATFANGAADFFGGGGVLIQNAQTVTFESCIFRDNTTTGFGGGIAAFAPSDRLLTLVGCTISGNIAESAAGLYAAMPLHMVNCTVSGNESINPFNSFAGGLALEENARISYSTITNNRAVTAGGLLTLAPLTLAGTIVAGNHATSSNMDIVWQGLGAITSAGNNLIGDAAGITFTGPTDLVGLDPRLGPLAMNGGPTPTHALMAMSPALDHGPAGSCLGASGEPVDSDQRGLARPADGDRDGSARCDIGAFERPFTVPADLDGDGDVDGADRDILQACSRGAAVPHDGSPACVSADLDADGDGDQDDFGLLQRCFSGSGVPADPACAP